MWLFAVRLGTLAEQVLKPAHSSVILAKPGIMAPFYVQQVGENGDSHSDRRRRSAAEKWVHPPRVALLLVDEQQ